MFETGFLTIQAPLYMDIVTLYFLLLPFLLAVAIRFAVKGNQEAHYKMQLFTFIITLFIVVIFEVGIRISGGFATFMQDSSANYSWMLAFLIFHIIIAVASVVVWATLIYGAVKHYKLEHEALPKYHKLMGKIVFVGLTSSSIMGAMIYYFLFIY